MACPFGKKLTLVNEVHVLPHSILDLMHQHGMPFSQDTHTLLNVLPDGDPHVSEAPWLTDSPYNQASLVGAVGATGVKTDVMVVWCWARLGLA